MNKTNLLLTIILITLLGGQALFAQNALSKKAEDHKAIKSMCGCHEVTFEYAETFSPDTAYQFHERKTARGLEWIVLAEDQENKIVLQHLLVVGQGRVIKHWRQDWLYENQDLYSFVKSNHWQYEQLSANLVKGQWTQKVFQVDDSPRYEGSATWIHADGKHYWESEVDAPLPRREYTKRSDYNVMRRTNRHEITTYGHVHDQDNEKIVRSEAGEQLLAKEKGLNTYRKVEESRCQAAKDWWEKNQRFWKDVRLAWDGVFARNKDLKLQSKVDDKRIWQHLFELGDEISEAESYDSTQIQARITSIINKYIK